MILNAKGAISEHMKWRMRFQLAIELREAILPDTLARIHNHNACPIGEWLISPVMGEFRALPEFHDLVRSHLHFHREMTRLAASINDGQFDDAMRMLASGSSFQVASQQIANAILAFDRVKSIAIPTRLQ
jgi:methyl-accepting chemotaxis protein